MSLRVNPLQVREDATAQLFFIGPPLVTVTWVLTAGAGTLTPSSANTDAQGKAHAKYEPIEGETGTTVTITVTHGT